MQYLKIPKERISVLIGKSGNTKEEIEKKTKTKIVIDKTDCSVEVGGTDAVGEWIAKDIVHAIGRGFNPGDARILLSDENRLEIISLKEFCHTEKSLVRKRGRIIGKKGKSKRVIESLTGTRLSIYGKTVGIIGPLDGVEIAKESIIKILEGSRHSSVYRFLEQNMHELKKNLKPI